MKRAACRLKHLIRRHLWWLRRESHSLRPKTVIVAAMVLGVAPFVAGGLYHHYSTNALQETAAPFQPTAPATVTRSDKKISFPALETPRPVPELRFVDGDGREMTLKAFEGQMVLLNIWATWCVPCREEMPALDRLQAKLGGPDFQVVPLSIDREGLPKVNAFYQELGLKALGIYVDQTGKAANELGAIGIPTTLLLDISGREIGRSVGPAEWDSHQVLQALQRYMEPQTAMPDRPEGGQ